MRPIPVGPIVSAFAILIAVTLAEQFKWLPSGRAKPVIVFLCGVSIVVCLRIGGIPPWWFAGEKEGFGLAVSLLLWGFVADAKGFGPPLIYGMGLAVLAANVVSMVRLHL